MNILIPYSWLKEYLDTKATPEKIAECLSLCSASVEKINKVNNDSVFDIEITTNRVDMMSIAGIAREATAVLPQFGIKAKLKSDPYESKVNPPTGGQDSKLKVIIKNQSLCPRFTAILLDQIKIKPSPNIIQERLKKVGVRSLNNVIDVSNYLMHEFGQPVHVFDFDKILGAKMILRESKKGEVITTLDGKTHKLLGGEIVIEDGKARLIDLCGIMGGENSAVDSKTKRVLLFVQTYEPAHIRKTAMGLSIRTEAATLFEKSIDPELVMPTLKRGVELLKKVASGKIAGKIIDIYPNHYKSKVVKVSLQLIKDRLGISIQSNKVIKNLNSLGFQINQSTTHQLTDQQLTISVPSWRTNDVNIPEDIIEEVARIYGYHNLLSVLLSVLPPLYQQPISSKIFFEWEEKTKQTLKNWGFTELYTYSMQSEEQLRNFYLDPKKHLKIKNPLTLDLLYMRTSLLPSILLAIAQNLEQKEEIKFFELANTYLPQNNNLPDERPVLTLAVTGNKFYKLKGIGEALFSELGIKEKYVELVNSGNCWFVSKSTIIKHQNLVLGIVGEIKPEILTNFKITQKVVVADLDFKNIALLANNQKTYIPIPKYPPVIEDLTFEIPPKVLVNNLIEAIKLISLLVYKVELSKIYKNTRTFRITYLHPKRNLSDEEITKIRKEIILKVTKKGLGTLKGKVMD